MIELGATAPVFPVDDVGATVRWFEQKLGFTWSTHPDVEPYEWASMVRDNVEIMLQRVVGYEKPSLYSRREGGVWDVYIRVKGIRQFYDEIPPDVNVISPLTHLEYGCDEFEVMDLNGYTLVFGECA